jgi:uncharacterized damage-inducible protein DinB
MREREHIAKLFEALYNGNPWIDVTILGTLKKLPAVKATQKVSPELNSIWQLVDHIVSWRLNVLQRVQGKIMTTPENNYITVVRDSSEASWQQALKSLEDSQALWISFLNNCNEGEFEKIYPKNSLSYYEHIHGILQHDAYHLGQIVLLSKLV